jgi:multiple sugar transport system permease protein
VANTQETLLRTTDEIQADAQQQQRRAQTAKSASWVLRYTLILIITIIFTFPFVWMALASFQRQLDIISPALAFTPTMANFERVLGEQQFPLYMWNSFLVAVLSTLFSLMLGLPASYAIARFRYDWLGVILLTARIVPGITFLVPWYILFSSVGLTGTYTSLILSHMIVTMPFVVWVMIPFFEALPRELEESALIDGASVWGGFIRIVLPLAVPAIVTASIMSFIFSWNNFMFSLVLAGDTTRTLPVAIFNFMTYASIDWGGLMAASVLITLPVLIITIFMQRYVVSGLTAGAVKG